MSTYYSDHDLEAYAAQLYDYEVAHQAWEDSQALADSAHDQAMDAYQAAHDYWESVGGIDPATDTPIPEPQPPADPVYPPEPVPPDEPSLVFDSREVSEFEEVETATGPALIAPGRILLSSDGGATAFAVSPEELDAGYTPTSDPLPPAQRRPTW